MNKKPLVVLLAAALSTMASVAFAAEDTVDIPRLVVTSDPLGNRTSDELIQPVTVIAGDELNQKRASTLGETLDGLPGVHNADFGQGVGRPVVRGLQGSRVQVLEDGLSTSDISGEGADHAIGLDTGRADQIEVFRGPALCCMAVAQLVVLSTSAATVLTRNLVTLQEWMAKCHTV